jgi:hypothetical protein
MHNLQGDAVPSVMNHGDARHFRPYGRLWSILGAVGISVMVRADWVAETGDPSIHVLVPANISSMTPQDPENRTEGAVAEKWCS